MPVYNFSTFDDPSATSFVGTQAFGINGSGQIVGVYADGSGNHGFLYNPNGGTYTTLDDPLATNGTLAAGINASGQIVGYYATNTGNHGFLYNPNGGTYTTIDYPLAGPTGTLPFGINDMGQIVGTYFDNANNGHGFLETTLPNPPPPAGTTADMILRDGSDGRYEIYDIGSNAILAGDFLG